jgi:hypothetical protein
MAAEGCTTPPVTPQALPEQYELTREQLQIHADFPLASQHRLLEDLTARRFDVGRELGLPLSDEPIHIYLFENGQRMAQFVQSYHPDFPARRAFFVETDTRLIVYAHWGDRVGEDLRHEVTHGYLHSMIPHLPLWLDEGLAEYFEVPRGQGGMNRTHLDLLMPRLRKGLWRPDLRRLERLDSAFGMTDEDYAEAWAWVHCLLQGGQPQGDLFRAYLADLRRDGTAEPLSQRLVQALGRPEETLALHIRNCAAQAAP